MGAFGGSIVQVSTLCILAAIASAVVGVHGGFIYPCMHAFQDWLLCYSGGCGGFIKCTVKFQVVK